MNCNKNVEVNQVYLNHYYASKSNQHNLALSMTIKNCSGPAKRIIGPLLRPNTIQSPNFTFGVIACNIPFLCEGVHKANETGSNEPQRLFARSARSRNKLSGGYTSHDFVTARAKCASSTALQPSTSINRGLSALPKVELFLPLKPSLSESLLT
jgi:hypothetical protein